MRFLTFILQPEEILRMVRANGAVPGTHPALARSHPYGTGGSLRLFATQLVEGYAVARPRTPAYPVISSAFEEAFLAIRNGADVREALDGAVRVIDRDIRDNHGYPLEALQAKNKKGTDLFFATNVTNARGSDEK